MKLTTKIGGGVLVFAYGLIGVSVVLARYWPIELLAHFRFQQVIMILMLTMIYLFSRHYRLGLGMGLLALITLMMMPGVLGQNPVSQSSQRTNSLEILMLNSSLRTEPVLRAVDRSPEPPDLVFMTENPPGHRDTFEKNLPEYDNVRALTLYKVV